MNKVKMIMNKVKMIMNKEKMIMNKVKMIMNKVKMKYSIFCIQMYIGFAIKSKKNGTQSSFF